MERRKIDRRDFSYYMRVLDASTDQLVGYLSDISTTGFKLDSQKPLRLGQDYRLKIELTSEIADKTALVFLARTKWCRPDHVDPSTYNVGFEIISMSTQSYMMADTIRRHRPLVVLLGPTATGKSAVGVQVALRCNTDILTADSRQVYRGMDIGTDKPSLQERQGIAHRLIDLVDPDEPYNAGRYQPEQIPVAR